MRAENQVYVLRNAEGRHYIGLSHDPETRLQQHNNGQSSWTKRRGPWQLIWVSDKLSLSAARQLDRWSPGRTITVRSPIPCDSRPQPSTLSRSFSPFLGRAAVLEQP